MYLFYLVLSFRLYHSSFISLGYFHSDAVGSSIYRSVVCVCVFFSPFVHIRDANIFGAIVRIPYNCTHILILSPFLIQHRPTIICRSHLITIYICYGFGIRNNISIFHWTSCRRCFWLYVSQMCLHAAKQHALVIVSQSIRINIIVLEGVCKYN